METVTAFNAAYNLAQTLSASPDVVDLEHQEPMLYLWQVRDIITNLKVALDNEEH
jgi:hypothetical protein